MSSADAIPHDSRNAPGTGGTASGWTPLTHKDDRMTCRMPTDETVVEVMLQDGTVCPAWYSCDIMDAGDWDFIPVTADGEPDDAADSIASKVIAWRSPPAPAASPACGGAVWRVGKWGNGSSAPGESNIFCDAWETAIATDLPTETATEIVEAHNLSLAPPEQGEVVRELVEAATYLLSEIDAPNGMDSVIEASEKLRAALAKIGGAK